MLLCRHRRVCG